MVEKLSEELASLYRVHIPEYVETLETAIAEEDLVNMRDVAHNLSSALGSIGDLESSVLFKQIEKEPMPLKDVQELLAKAKPLVDRTLSEI